MLHKAYSSYGEKTFFQVFYFRLTFHWPKQITWMAKSRGRAISSAYYEAKASHRAKLNIKEAKKYIPPKKTRVGEEVNIC